MTPLALVRFISSQELDSSLKLYITAAKGKFIADNDMAGFAVWHVGGDSGDILLDAISDSMGLEQICS